MSDTRAQPPLASEFAHPWPVAALLVLAANDHLLKGAGVLPGWLTGKLSDFAGLFLFPIVLFVLADAVARAGARAMPRSAAAIACAAATALAFATLKLHPGINAAASAHWGPIALDPSDLIALPMCGAAAAWLAACSAAARPTFHPDALRYALLIAASLACLATSPPLERVRAYPAWQLLDHGRHEYDCAALAAWVSKSGKQGVGITLALSSRETGTCEVAVQHASFTIGGRRVQAISLPTPALLGQQPNYLYLPFAFDNNEAWNRGELRAVLDLGLAINGQPIRFSRELAHRWSSPHRIVSLPRPPRPTPSSDAGVAPASSLQWYPP